MFTKIISLLLFLAVLTGVWVHLNKQSYPQISDKLEFQRIDGVKQRFAELKGKPLLITFWSPSCVICMREVEDFNRLYQQNNGGKDFEILALSMYYDRPDWVLQTRIKSGMTYPVYFDLQKNLSSAFGHVVATPTSFLLDHNGQVIYHHVGRLDFPTLKNKLKQLIG